MPVAAAMVPMEVPQSEAAGTAGPFAFGDEQYTASLLTAAGFASVKRVPENKSMPEKKPMRFMLNLTQSLGQIFAEMGSLGHLLPAVSEPIKTQIFDSITAALSTFVEGDAVMMDGAE